MRAVTLRIRLRADRAQPAKALDIAAAELAV